MPNAADLMVQRIENTEADLIRFGSNVFDGLPVVRKIQEQLSAMIESGNTILILDLSDIVSVSSEMLGVMVEVNKAATEKGGGVHLLNPTPNVLKALEISKLNKILAIHDSLEAAIEKISPS